MTWSGPVPGVPAAGLGTLLFPRVTGIPSNERRISTHARSVGAAGEGRRRPGAATSGPVEEECSVRDAVIVEAVRTPVGKRNGGLSGVHPVSLSAHVLKALAGRSGIDPAVVDDVVWGCVGQVGEQTFDIARNAVLAAGWPETVTGVTVDRQCGSSQQSVHFAAAGLIAGQYDVVVAGGVESMSRVPMGASIQGANPMGPEFGERYGGVFPNQGVGAEMMAERWGLSRAQDDGRFEGQIAPVTNDQGELISADEGIRRGTTVEVLAKLKTVFKPDGGV